MRKSLILVISLLLFTISGCGSNPPVVQIQNKLLTPDDNLLQDCVVTHPPDKDVYIGALEKEREKMLVTYSSSLLNDLFTCNNQLKALREWKRNSISVLSGIEDRK